MFVRSKNRNVEVIVSGISNIVSMNTRYDRVNDVVSSFSQRNIPRIFEDNKQRYCQRALEGIGQYEKGLSYLHYEKDGAPDPRCRCILCWIRRRKFSGVDYPTVKAKLLCIADQLREERVHKKMPFELFRKVVYTAVPSANKDAVDFLWETLFPGSPHVTEGGDFDIEPEIERILSDQNILQIRGVPESSDLKDRINELQDRMDKEYEFRKRTDELCNMSEYQLNEDHIGKLKVKLKQLHKYKDPKLEEFCKNKFLHDHLMRNMSDSRIKTTKYKGFEGIRLFDEKKIKLKSKMEEMDAKIVLEKKKYYLLDSLVKMLGLYKEFNKEFRVFLTKVESDHFDKLFKSSKIRSTLLSLYRLSESKVILEYLKQTCQKLVEDNWDEYSRLFKNRKKNQKDTRKWSKLNMFKPYKDLLEELKEKEKGGAILETDVNKLKQVLKKHAQLEKNAEKFLKGLDDMDIDEVYPTLRDRTEKYVNKIETIYNLLEQRQIEIRKEEQEWNGIYWVGIVQDLLDLIDTEVGIHKYGMEKAMPRVNCTVAVQQYIETIWDKIRSGGMDYMDVTVEGFKALQQKLHGSRIMQYATAYADKKIVEYLQDNFYLSDSVMKKVDQSWTDSILRLIIDFMNKNGLKTFYNERDDAYGGFEVKSRIKFYKNEFSFYSDRRIQQILTLDFNKTRGLTFYEKEATYFKEFLEKIGFRSSYDERDFRKIYYNHNNYAVQPQNVQKIIDDDYRKHEVKYRLQYYSNEFQRYKKDSLEDIRGLWDDIESWYTSKNKNRHILSIARETFSSSTEKEVYQQYISYKKFAKTSFNTLDRITAEMYLIFDAFRRWEVDDDTMDKYIVDRLPPGKRKIFSNYMIMMKNRLDTTENIYTKDYIQDGIAQLRNVYKDMVFDVEILKRSILLDLKRTHEAILLGLRDLEKGKWYVKEQHRGFLEMVQMIDEAMGVKDYSAREWIPFKYTYGNNHKWVLKQSKVMVFYKYDDGWTDTSNRTECLSPAWVVGVDDQMVVVELENPLRISNMDEVRTLNVLETDIRNVYESKFDYDVLTNFSREYVRTIKEKQEKLQRLREKDLERRRLNRSIIDAELIEELEERKRVEKEEKNQILMYDPDKADERLDFFLDWLSKLKDKTENMSTLVKEFKKEPHFIVMFEDGRKQWIRKYGLENPDNRGDKVDDYERSYNVINELKHIPQRAKSLRYTYEYFKFMWMLPAKKDVVRMMIIEKVDGNTPDQRETAIKQYMKKIEAAIDREDKRLKSVSNRRRRSREILLGIFDDIIKNINSVDEDPRLFGEENPEVIEYNMSRRLYADAEMKLKTPKWKYTESMLLSEIETSLNALDGTTFQQMKYYVTKKTKEEYLQGKRNVYYEETQYQKDFKGKDTKGLPVYPVPSNEDLLKEVKLIKPSKLEKTERTESEETERTESEKTERTESEKTEGTESEKTEGTESEKTKKTKKVTVPVRIGLGPGSWYVIDKTSHLMRRTGLSIEDRLLFAEDVAEMRENEKDSGDSKRFRKIYDEMRRLDWIDSDGDGSIRVLDDFVGEFRYSKDMEKTIQTPNEDVPTHIRLHCMYLDSVRGRGKDKRSVQRLVPFYVVSFYMKEETMYRRLKVRNRSRKTFLPLQNKLKYTNKHTKLYQNEDYRGYECSVCLSQEEFDELTKGRQMTPGVDRRIVQIPTPLLSKYHSILYEKAKEDMLDKLTERKRQQISIDTPIPYPVVTVGPGDDMSAPYSDGMIRLGGEIRSMKMLNRQLVIGDRVFDMQGNIVQAAKPEGIYFDNNRIYKDSDQVRTLPYECEILSVQSSNLIATYGRKNADDFMDKGVVDVWYQLPNKQICITTTRFCSMLRWSEKTLLVMSQGTVKGYSEASRFSHTLTLTGHLGLITCMEVKEKLIVTGSKDNTLILWNNKHKPIKKNSRVLVNDKKKYRFGDVIKKVDNVHRVKLLKSPGNSEKEGTFECTPTAHRHTFYGHTGAVKYVVWGKYIVSSAEDKTIIVWDTKGKIVFKFDYRKLKLVEPASYTRAPFIALGDEIALGDQNILFYGIGKILAKMDIRDGTFIAFDKDVVNKSSDLPLTERDASVGVDNNDMVEKKRKYSDGKMEVLNNLSDWDPSDESDESDSSGWDSDSSDSSDISI